ncbi:MAG TPA: 16S rRNA (cytosine(1402)-N(4))-methyltransferase RsmH, partial [Firmicutes bacterium]|nr:16S rRNA (cytosine(1402)-N(4))-methyltransferase RsmH [Bacillota bacterium]
MEFSHVPVLLEEALDYLKVSPGGVFVDTTLGGGGHASEILKRLMPGGILVGMDRDRDALEAASRKLKEFGPAFIPVHANFANIAAVLAGLKIKKVNGFLFDLGVSSFQLDNPARGFTYNEDVLLDMRMDTSCELTAAQLVNTLSENELAAIIKNFGEERWSRRIAAKIVNARETEGEIKTTGRLVDIIKEAIPARFRREGGHPARRTFQALRIAVNNELKNIEQGIRQAIPLLTDGGRIVVITFHSLEDRLVKRIFKENQGECQCPPSLPQCVCDFENKNIRVITSKAVTPRAEEVMNNPRARSARLRA